MSVGETKVDWASLLLTSAQILLKAEEVDKRRKARSEQEFGGQFEPTDWYEYRLEQYRDATSDLMDLIDAVYKLKGNGYVPVE